MVNEQERKCTMMMGGLALAACLVPLIAIGMVVVALIGVLMGKSPDLLERLLPPGIHAVRPVADPAPHQAKEQRVDYEPLGTRQTHVEDTAEPLGYVRTCHECGASIERKLDNCPSCGAKLYWK
jgi:hypothetical protein